MVQPGPNDRPISDLSNGWKVPRGHATADPDWTIGDCIPRNLHLPQISDTARPRAGDDEDVGTTSPGGLPRDLLEIGLSSRSGMLDENIRSNLDVLSAKLSPIAEGLVSPTLDESLIGPGSTDMNIDPHKVGTTGRCSTERGHCIVAEDVDAQRERVTKPGANRAPDDGDHGRNMRLDHPSAERCVSEVLNDAGGNPALDQRLRVGQRTVQDRSKAR